MVQIKLEVPAINVVLADQLGVIGLVDRRLQDLALGDELAANIDVGDMRAHGEAGEERAFDQELRIMTHDVTVLAGAGLRLVGIDDEIVRAAVGLGRHERPFEPGGKSGTTAAAQAGGLHLLDDRLRPALDHGLGAVPGAARARSLEPPRVQPVEILEDAVLVLKHYLSFAGFVLRPLASGGLGTAASRTLAAAPGRFASLSVSASSTADWSW